MGQAQGKMDKETAQKLKEMKSKSKKLKHKNAKDKKNVKVKSTKRKPKTMEVDNTNTDQQIEEYTQDDPDKIQPSNLADTQLASVDNDDHQNLEYLQKPSSNVEPQSMTFKPKPFDNAVPANLEYMQDQFNTTSTRRNIGQNLRKTDTVEGNNNNNTESMNTVTKHVTDPREIKSLHLELERKKSGKELKEIFVDEPVEYRQYRRNHSKSKPTITKENMQQFEYMQDQFNATSTPRNYEPSPVDADNGEHKNMEFMRIISDHIEPKQEKAQSLEAARNKSGMEMRKKQDIDTNTAPGEYRRYKPKQSKSKPVVVKKVERRLNQIRDNMGQWDSVDRMRGDLRAWLHDMQEEVEELEQQPSKLHAEAAELDISKLQAIREEVQARGPAIEGLLSRYRELTQHNPSLNDPVVKAVKDDWEELLGQIENLIEDREHSMQAAKELQAHENDMDDDLENYINELEKIETAQVATTQKADMMKTRKPCRSTQTPRGSAQNPNRSFLTGESDDDDTDDLKKQFPRRRPGSRASSHHSLKPHKKGLNSSRHRSPRHSRPGSRYDDLKKRSSGAALDSESEESGYGETYYTMHASSFDNNLDATTGSVFEQPTLDTMRGTPIGLENHFSDGESTVSYLSTSVFERANPEDLRDADSQTPGHTATQTPANMWDNARNKPRNIMTQTQSLTSLHSIGNQTRRSSGSRADLLRNILFEVKGLKEQRGLDTSSYQGSEDDDRSIVSDNTVKKETLQTVLEDVRTIRDADATGNAATQTVQEEGTQTSMKLFPEGDPVRNARLDRFRNIMDDVKQMKGSRAGTPSVDSRSHTSTRATTPMESTRRRRATPVTFSPPNEAPVQNGYHYPPPPQQNLNATAPPVMMNPPVYAPPPGRRMVTQDDLNAINHRLERLQGYMTPQRPPPPPPPPQPEYVIPVYAQPPRQRRPQKEDTYFSDESEYGDVEPPRRRQIRASIDSALEEASHSALQLKRLSKRMKDSLRDDMQYDLM